MIVYANLTYPIVTKGQGANMCKVGNKRRRTMAQIKEDKKQAILDEQEQNAAMAELASLRQRMAQAEQMALNNQASADVLNKMIKSGAA